MKRKGIAGAIGFDVNHPLRTSPLGSVHVERKGEDSKGVKKWRNDMRKLVFVLGLVLSFNANGEIVTGDKCGDNCTWTFDTETGKLTVSGTGEMYDWGKNDTGNRPYEGSVSTYQTEAPWGDYSGQISNIEIKNGITALGMNAFYNLSATSVIIPDSVTDLHRECFQYSNLRSVSIPSSVTSIPFAAFDGVPLTSIDLPDTITSIGYVAFRNTGLTEFIVPDSVTSIDQAAFLSHGTSNLEKLVISDSVTSIGDKAFNGLTATVYCAATSPCADKGSENIVAYEKQGGVYILEDGTKFLSAADMAGGTNICNKELNECKRNVLEAKGICQGSSCDTFIQSDGKYMLKFGSKTYQDINALLKGDYDRRRIYTIEEANFVAGDKNRVSITYK